MTSCAPAVEITEEAEEGPRDFQGDLIISTWGGTAEEFVRSYVEPRFHEMYPNVTIVYDVGGQGARLNKLIAQKDNPEVNLFMSTPEAFYIALNEGLLQPINQDNVPEMENVFDWAVPEPEYGVGTTAYAYAIGYNPDFFGDDPPTSWLDLWRPEVQGKLVLPAIGHSMMTDFLIGAAEIHGGSQDNIEPGVEALAKLQPVGQSYFYTDWMPLWEAGDAVMVVDFDIYINRFKDEQGGNIEFVIPEEGAYGLFGHYSLVKGTEGELKEAAEYFINLVISQEVQADNPEGHYIAPIRADVVVSDKFDELLAAYGDSLAQVRWIDPKFKADHRAEWTELLNQTVAPAWGE